MNVQEGPEWEIASHLLSDLRSVLHNQALSVGDLVDKLNAFDFSLLLNEASCVIRKAAMLWMMVVWRHLRLMFLSQVRKRLFGGTQSPHQMTCQDVRSKIRRLRDIPNPARFTDLVHVTELLSMKIQSPLVLSSARKCVYLVLKPEQLQTELKLSTKIVFSEQQVFSYFLRRRDRTYTQLGFDMSRIEQVLDNLNLLSTVPDPQTSLIFSTNTQSEQTDEFLHFLSFY